MSCTGKGAADEQRGLDRATSLTRFVRLPVVLNGIVAATPIPAQEWTEAERTLVQGAGMFRAVISTTSESTVRIIYGANGCFELPTSVTATDLNGKTVLSVVFDETGAAPSSQRHSHVPRRRPGTPARL